MLTLATAQPTNQPKCSLIPTKLLRLKTLLIVLLATDNVLKHITGVVDDFADVNMSTLVRMVHEHQTTIRFLDFFRIAVDGHFQKAVVVCIEGEGTSIVWMSEG